MTLFALFAASIASTSPSTPSRPPTPLPVVFGVKAGARGEVVRVAFLGFDVNRAPSAPRDLDVRLSSGGQTLPMKLHRRWQGVGAVAGGWAVADYLLIVPHGVSGDAVLSLGGAEDGWRFRIGRM